MRWIPGILLLLFACRGQESRPEVVLDEQKMSAVLADVHLLEAAYTIEFARSDSSRKLMEAYYNQVFEKHQISRQTFEESMNWYTVHHEEMIRVQEKTTEILQELSGKIPPTGGEKK